MNLDKTYQFQAELNRATDYYIHQLTERYMAFREELANALTLEKMGSTAQRRRIKKATSALNVAAVEVSVQSIDRLTSPIARYMDRQLEDVRAVTNSGIAIQDLEKQIQDQKAEIVDRLLLADPEWVGLVELRILREINRMIVNNEPMQAIVARLAAMETADGRVSVWRSGRNSLTLEADRNVWSMAAAILALYYETGGEMTGRNWKKQAIAAIDHKTTNCCLQVHGQTQPLNKRFHLTGTPRFADYMMHPGFHWRCRTAEALYLPEFESIGITTDEMKTAARNELQARRETGRRSVIKPADAISGR